MSSSTSPPHCAFTLSYIYVHVLEYCKVPRSRRSTKHEGIFIKPNDNPERGGLHVTNYIHSFVHTSTQWRGYDYRTVRCMGDSVSSTYDYILRTRVGAIKSTFFFFFWGGGGGGGGMGNI